MYISPLAPSTTSATDPSSQIAERRQNFQALDAALQGGDLQAAQHAFAAIQQSLPGQSSGSTSISKTSGGSGQVATDFQALGQALQSGDLAGAQKAFATLQQDGQKVRGHHRHHHQSGGDASATAKETSSATTPAADAGGANTSVGTLLNTVA